MYLYMQRTHNYKLNNIFSIEIKKKKTLSVCIACGFTQINFCTTHVFIVYLYYYYNIVVFYDGDSGVMWSVLYNMYSSVHTTPSCPSI